MRLRALIVDDEALARDRIRNLLHGESDVEVVGECDGGAPAIEAVRRERPDVLFLDVQMPEVDGFAVTQEIRDDLPPAIVFVTAYEEHALRAFDAHALDYLLKPFREDRFRETVDRARRAVAAAQPDRLDRSIDRLLDSMRTPAAVHDKLVLRTPGRVHLVPLEDIQWFESAGNYVLVHVGGRSHLVRETMADLAARLDARFVRIHRSTIVNLDHVREVRTTSGGDGRVILQSSQELALSRRYRGRLDEALGH